MKVSIVYATVEGQTEKIARFLSEKTCALGHDAQLMDVDDPSRISLADSDAVILAASVHQRRHPRNFEAFLGLESNELANKKTLLLSVSLSAAFPDGLQEAQEYVLEMKMRTKFEPDQTELVAGAVRLGEYDYFALQVVRHVVLRDHDYDVQAGNHEFTNWDDLTKKVTAFLG
ncbi:MAG: flavodoxin domain-containing protein [Pseudomonadota bacterium]